MSFTEVQIETWKKAHGDIFLIEIEDASCVLRTPTRKDMSYASAGASGVAFKVNEMLFDSCWLGGDEKIKTDISYFLSAIEKFSSVVEVKEAAIKKL